MEQPKVWTPPAKIDEIYEHLKGNQFAAANSATSGARTQKALPVGNAKVSIVFVFCFVILFILFFCNSTSYNSKTLLVQINFLIFVVGLFTLYYYYYYLLS